MATLNPVIPQCERAIAQIIYSAGSGTATTTSGSAGPFPVDFFSSANILCAVTSCSGTLNIWLQKLEADGTTYSDIAHITSLTTSTETKAVSFVNGGNTVYIPGNQVLATGSVLTVNFGGYWRLAWQISGASATHTFGIYGDFFA